MTAGVDTREKDPAALSRCQHKWGKPMTREEISSGGYLFTIERKEILIQQCRLCGLARRI